MSERRVGIIGTGFMGEVHTAAWRAIGSAPSAVLARSTTLRPAYLGNLEVDIYDDLQEFLAAVDIVDICAPTHLHAEFALAVAAAGKPAICEKPLSLSVDEGLEVIRAFERAGVHLHVGHILRYSPEYTAARQAVEAGRIGEPAVLRLSRLSFAPERGQASWFQDDSKSGGIAFDLMIHDLDYARWIAGEVVSVFAKSAPKSRGHAIAILKHAGGAITHIESSWSSPAPEFRTSFEIAGEHGILGFSSGETTPLTLRLHEERNDSSTGLGDMSLAANPFELELQNFLEVVDGTAHPAITPRDALAAVQLAAAVRQSARTGQPVRIESIGKGE